MRRAVVLGLALFALLAGCSGGQSSASSSNGLPASLNPKTLTIPPLPSGWKTVTHQEIGIDVPKDWTVKPWAATCGVTEPTVYIGPQGLPPKCTTSAPGAQAIMGAFAYQGAQTPVITHINGMGATEVTTQVPIAGPPAGTATEIWVRLITGTPTATPFGLFIAAGDSTAYPGGGPGIAQKIAGTIHSTLA